MSGGPNINTVETKAAKNHKNHSELSGSQVVKHCRLFSEHPSDQRKICSDWMTVNSIAVEVYFLFFVPLTRHVRVRFAGLSWI